MLLSLHHSRSSSFKRLWALPRQLGSLTWYPITASRCWLYLLLVSYGCLENIWPPLWLSSKASLVMCYLLASFYSSSTILLWMMESWHRPFTLTIWAVPVLPRFVFKDPTLDLISAIGVVINNCPILCEDHCIHPYCMNHHCSDLFPPPNPTPLPSTLAFLPFQTTPAPIPHQYHQSIRVPPL